MATVRDAMLERVSWPKVTDDAPDHDELVGLVAAAGRVADHAGLTPWRLIELREDDRVRLGAAFTEVLGHDGSADKPLRAPLLIAIVSSTKPHPKGSRLGTGSGGRRRRPRVEPAARRSRLRRHLAHRTVHPRRTRRPPTWPRRERKLLGWLYVGGKPDMARAGHPVDAEQFLTRLPV